MKLSALGLCGIDDSTDITHLQIIAQHYPFAEWGVLFRPDKEGTPRYASEAWITQLADENARRGLSMSLAGHLCGSRVNEVLRGDSTFVASLLKKGFRRVQVNATVINGCDTSNISEWPGNIMKCMRATEGIEWILQCNDETNGPLVQPVLASSSRPRNMSILYDASCGTGVLPSSFPAPPEDSSIRCGYAGGIGPSNIVKVLATIKTRDGLWVDMESSLRSIVDGKDIFSLDKAFACIQQTLKGGFVDLIPTNSSPPAASITKERKGTCPMVPLSYFMSGMLVATIFSLFLSKRR